MSSNKKYNTRSSRMRDIELPARNMSVSVVSLFNRTEYCKLVVKQVCKGTQLEDYIKIGLDCFKRTENQCMGKPMKNF